jgi:hypothetical protein
MLSADKLKEICRQRQMSVEQLAGGLVRAGLDQGQAIVAVKNWQRIFVVWRLRYRPR